MSSYKELEVYQSVFKLAIDIHNIIMKLPKYELYEQGSQIRRASKVLKIIFQKAMGERNIKLILLDF